MLQYHGKLKVLAVQIKYQIFFSKKIFCVDFAVHLAVHKKFKACRESLKPRENPPWRRGLFGNLIGLLQDFWPTFGFCCCCYFGQH